MSTTVEMGTMAGKICERHAGDMRGKVLVLWDKTAENYHDNPHA
jgi:hypothetical protein